MHAVRLLPSPPVRGAGLPVLFPLVYASVNTGFWRPFSKFACAEISFHAKPVHRHVHTFLIWARLLHTTDLPNLVERAGGARAVRAAKRVARGRGIERKHRGRAIQIHADSRASEQTVTNWEQRLQFMRGGLSDETRETPNDGSVLTPRR
jgi:hypothetical protein